jgi:Glycosyl transferases group 1
MNETLQIGLIGPDQTQPCGIADYTARLAEALHQKAGLIFLSYAKVLDLSPEEAEALESCQAILLQYERSLVPDSRFLKSLALKYPDRVFVIPHEVYDQDPFAFPYEAIRSPILPLLWIKRLAYKLKHRDYAREKALQAKAYEARGVFPLSGPGAVILRALAAHKILETIPLASYIPPENPVEQLQINRENFFPKADSHHKGTQKVIGIFGFLNPGLDYNMVLELLSKLEKEVSLLILGGFRTNAKLDYDPESEAEKRGLSHRVRLTGFLKETELAGHFALCDIFLCPMRFKSNSSSILNLIHLKKTILASDIPLTRYLQAEGAPLKLYSNFQELELQTKKALEGIEPVLENRYPWTFDRVADAYVQAIRYNLNNEPSKASINPESSKAGF